MKFVKEQVEVACHDCWICLCVKCAKGGQTSRTNPLHGRAVEGEGPWNWKLRRAFLQERTMEMETTALSCRKGPWNWKPRRFPAGKDRGIGNHDTFLQERIVELETMTLSCRKGPWNWNPRRFPGGKDHGIGNHDAFLQERIMDWKTMMLSCRKGSCADFHNHSPRDSHDHSPAPGLTVWRF